MAVAIGRKALGKMPGGLLSGKTYPPFPPKVSRKKGGGYASFIGEFLLFLPFLPFYLKGMERGGRATGPVRIEGVGGLGVSYGPGGARWERWEHPEICKTLQVSKPMSKIGHAS
jgi:hypothetical protein